MPQSVERVVSKRHCNSELGEDLERQRPRGEAGGQHGALEVPADGGRNQVQDAEDVEAAAQGDTGDAVEGRAVPGDLRLVDAEMGRDGAVQALLCEDLVRGLGRGHGRGGGISAVAVVSGGGSGRSVVCAALPALCGEGGAHGNGSRSREPGGRCLGGHWEVVSWDRGAVSRTRRELLRRRKDCCVILCANMIARVTVSGVCGGVSGSCTDGSQCSHALSAAVDLGCACLPPAFLRALPRSTPANRRSCII
jgi:hypothetical protein